jgi:hypothetical protein
VGCNEEVNVQVFRLNEDRQLPVKSERQIREDGGTAVGEIEIDCYERSGFILEDEAILPEVPDGDRVWRRHKRTNARHKCSAFHDCGQDQLNGRTAIAWIVPREVVVADAGHFGVVLRVAIDL